MCKQATHDLLPEYFQANACVIQSDDQQNTPGLDPLPLLPARQKGQYEMIDTVRTRRHKNADAAHRTQQVVFDMKMHRHAYISHCETTILPCGLMLLRPGQDPVQ